MEDGVAKGPEGQATTCHTTWVFSSDRKALSRTQECEQNGARWTAFRVKGTKSATRVGVDELPNASPQDGADKDVRVENDHLSGIRPSRGDAAP